MSVAENTCRTCGKASERLDGSDLHAMYTVTEYSNELKMVLEEFEIWNLNIAEGDGLPQKICLTCFDSFCQIHNFRMICQEAQINFCELCTGLDIIVRLESGYGDLDIDYPDDFEGEQTITIQEHYQFPGGERPKAPELLEVSKASEKILESNKSEKKSGLYSAEAMEEMDTVIKEFKQYQCEYCMEIVSFDDPELLNQHYNVLHSSELPYQCPKCKKSFDTKGKRNSHARIHYHTIQKCEICGKKVRGGQQMMAQHNEMNHIEKVRECITCGKKFGKITLKRFNYHLSWHDESKLHKCKYCEKKFIQLTHLVVHERTHTGESPFLCSECGVGFKNSGLLSLHIKMHGMKELQCPNCPKKFFHRHGLSIHMQVHDPSRKICRCDICEKPFRSSMNLRLHNHKRHGAPASPAVLNILKKREQKQALIKPYKCGKCSEAFVLHTQLMKHLKTHEENRPFTCNQCSKSFKREAHLKLHINSLHLYKKPHKCSICGWAFSQRGNLREHFAAKHEDKRDFKCETCGKAFAIAKTLRIHKLKHLEKKTIHLHRMQQEL